MSSRSASASLALISLDKCAHSSPYLFWTSCRPLFADDVVRGYEKSRMGESGGRWSCSSREPLHVLASISGSAVAVQDWAGPAVGSRRGTVCLALVTIGTELLELPFGFEHKMSASAEQINQTD